MKLKYLTIRGMIFAFILAEQSIAGSIIAPAETAVATPVGASHAAAPAIVPAASVPAAPISDTSKGKGKAKKEPFDKKINMPTPLERAMKALTKAQEEKENTAASPIATEKDKEKANKDFHIAEANVAVEKAKKEIADLANLPGATEKAKNEAHEKLVGAEKVLEDAKTSHSPVVATEIKAEESVGGPIGIVEESYKKPKETVETIVEEARKNPALKKKLEESGAKLKIAQNEQKDAQATFDVLNKEYKKLKGDPKSDPSVLKDVTDKRAAALAQLKKVNEALVKQKNEYESFLHETETTKQLRIREYKAALALRAVVAKELKAAEIELHALEAEMDKLLKPDSKAKDQDVTALEQKIETAQKHLDKTEENWERVKRGLAIAKLRSETVIEIRLRERDRAKERLAALMDRANGKGRGKKSKKGAKNQDLKDEIEYMKEDLAEKEKEVKTAQKRKDVNELDVAAVGFDPNDSQDEETLEEEITTPEERAAAKKSFHKVLKDYFAAKKTRETAEKQLIEAEKQYLAMKGKNQNKDKIKSKEKKSKDKEQNTDLEKGISVAAKKLRDSQFALIRAIRAELNAKQIYEITLRQTETLKETRLRVLRQLEALTKHLEKSFLTAKQTLTDSEAKLQQYQSAKPVDPKAVELTKEEVDLAKARIGRVSRDRAIAYRALKIARKKAGIYLNDKNDHGKGWEKQPLVERDEDDEEEQEEMSLELETGDLVDTQAVADLAGKVINEDLAGEGIDEEAPPPPAPVNAFNDLPMDVGDGLDSNDTNGFNGGQGGYNDFNAGGYNDPNAGGYNDFNAGGYNDPNAGGYNDPNAGGYSDPNAGAYNDLDYGQGGYMDPNAAYGAGRTVDMAPNLPPESDGGEVLPPPAEEMPPVEENLALVPAEEDEQSLAAQAAVASADEEIKESEDPAFAEEHALHAAEPAAEAEAEAEIEAVEGLEEEDKGPHDEDAERKALEEAHQEVDAAEAKLSEAQEAGNAKKIVDAQIEAEEAETKLAKAQIKQSPYGKEIKVKTQNSWENDYGRELFDPEAPDNGGVFSPRRDTSESVGDLLGSSRLNDSSGHLVDGSRIVAMQRPSSISASDKLNMDQPRFGTDTGIGALS